jgi:GT2 family glycosyltransferase
VAQVGLPFSVLVVDNAPTTGATRAVTDEFADTLDLRYTVEPRPGLSRARNCALRQLADEVTGDAVVAWLDDDEYPDRFWLAEVTRAFHADPALDVVSGLVVPAELETAAQDWFEQFGGHSKGRGFRPDRFSPETVRRQSPLYPLPPFGVGANMAFRLSALTRIGGFDEALGAGTPARGGEDTLAFTRILLAGGTMAYWPAAVVRHVHRRDLDGLTEQMRGYGSGLTAYYTALVVGRPALLVQLIRLAPRAMRDLLSPSSPRTESLGADFPQEVLAVNRRSMLSGPRLYLRGRRSARGERRSWREDEATRAGRSGAAP